MRIEFKMTDDRGVRHNIDVELEIISESRHMVIRKEVPEYCGGDRHVFVGRGATQSLAVVDWLRAVCASIQYVPYYRGKM